MSNNLNLSQVTAGQSQKEVTINEQSATLDAALTEEYSIVGDVNPTLTATEFAENVTFTTDGTQTALITLTVPSSQKKLFVVNNLLNAFNVDVDKGTTTVTVLAGTAQLLYADGTADGLSDFVPEAETVVPIYSWFAEGTYTPLEVIGTIVATKAATLPSGLTGSQGYAGTAPTGSIAIDIKKNGGSVGSIDFAAASNTATFTFASQVNLVAGDVLTFEAPTPADGTLADVSATLVTV